MNILHLTNTLMAGSPVHLSGIINKYTEHNSKCVVRRKFTGSKQRNLSWNYDYIGPTHKELSYLIDWCDIVHFHGKKYPIDIKGKPSLLQYHSEPRGYKIGSTDIEFKGRKLVIAQYHPRFFGDDCTIVPNLIDIWDDIYTANLENKSKDVIKIFFSWASNIKGTWSDKAVDSVIAILNRIKAERKGSVHIVTLTNTSYNKCIEEKRKADIVIGDCNTGSYHLSSLEGCAVGALTLNNSDSITLKYMRSVSNISTHPFVLTDVNNLYNKIMFYLDHRAKLMAEQLRSRNWMEKFWDPKKLVTLFISKYSEIIDGFKTDKYLNSSIRNNILIPRGNGVRRKSINSRVTPIRNCSSANKCSNPTGTYPSGDASAVIPINNPVKYDKYVLVGSAPYVKEYWPEVRDFYKQNGFKVTAINNAWSIVKDDIDEWFIPDDFMKGAGTVIPSKEVYNKLPVSPMPPGRVKGYLDPNTRRSTMALNAIHILFNRCQKNNSHLTLSVIGSDFVYEKDKSTHFYGKGSELPHVQRMLSQNNPEYAGLSADPLRFGDSWLKSELDNIKKQYTDANYSLYVDTPLYSTLLPFQPLKKVNKMDGKIPSVFVSVDSRIAGYLQPLYNSISKNTGPVNFNVLYDKSVSSELVSDYKLKGWLCHYVDLPEITFSKGRISKAMYFRWKIPQITDLEKAIYLDVDVLVLGDLNELWSIDLGENYVAAVPSHYRENVYEEWGRHCMFNIEPEERFKNIPLFFSGQLVINCKKWREDGIFDKLVEVSNKYKLYDMLALNIVVDKKFISIDKEWCFPGFIEEFVLSNHSEGFQNP